MNELLMSAEDLRNHNRVMSLILDHARQGESFTALGRDEKHVNQLRTSAKELLQTQNVRYNVDTVGDILLRSGETIAFKLAQEFAADGAVGFGGVEEFLKGPVEDVLNILTQENTSPILNEAAATESVIKRRENPPFISNSNPTKIVPPPYIEPMSMEDRRKVGLIKDTPPGERPLTSVPQGIPAIKIVEPTTEDRRNIGASEAPAINPLDVFTNDEEDTESPDQWGKGFRQDPSIEIERTANSVKITKK